MVQYFSQEQRSSGMSHCTQTVGPSIDAPRKLYLSKAARGKANMAGGSRVVHPFAV
jgi:hypothetical protein